MRSQGIHYQNVSSEEYPISDAAHSPPERRHFHPLLDMFLHVGSHHEAQMDSYVASHVTNKKLRFIKFVRSCMSLAMFLDIHYSRSTIYTFAD
jgi:hypothetical protein